MNKLNLYKKKLREVNELLRKFLIQEQQAAAIAAQAALNSSSNSGIGNDMLTKDESGAEQQKRKLSQAVLPWEINNNSQSMPTLESESKIIEATRLRKLEEEKKRKELEENKENERRYQEEIKRQFELFERQQLEQEKKDREDVEQREKSKQERESIISSGGHVPLPVVEEEVVLYVQGNAVAVSQITQEHLEQMTPEEFEQYEQLATEQAEI